MLNLANIILQNEDSGGIFAALFSGIGLICWFIFIVILIAAMWKIYAKAGKPGWASLIPFYNVWVLLEIVGRPGWWILLFFIPFVNIIVAILVSIDLAKSFGKSAVFGIVLLFIFNVIGYLMLGFGDAKYQGPAAT